MLKPLKYPKVICNLSSKTFPSSTDYQDTHRLYIKLYTENISLKKVI